MGALPDTGAPPLSNDIICSCINKAYRDLDARGFASEIRAFSLRRKYIAAPRYIETRENYVISHIN